MVGLHYDSCTYTYESGSFKMRKMGTAEWKYFQEQTKKVSFNFPDAPEWDWNIY